MKKLQEPETKVPGSTFQRCAALVGMVDPIS